MRSLFEETEHFCRGRPEKVAKIVQYGPPFTFNNLPLLIITLLPQTLLLFFFIGQFYWP
jgi:hypothetical protein